MIFVPGNFREEKQRVAVAVAGQKPTLVFADEPTAALDWEHGEQVVELLRESATQENATVLIVSHDPRVTPLADRVLFLADGKISGDHNIVDGMMESHQPSGVKESHG